MGVNITGKYVGNKRVELVHGPSGATIHTDAPKDNNGEGMSFSPTDLVASSLGACVLTVMGIVAERDGIDMSGSNFKIEKVMQKSPRRISALPLHVHLPKSLSDEERQKLERAGKTCPVHHSLLPEIDVTIDFIYDQ